MTSRPCFRWILSSFISASSVNTLDKNLALQKHVSMAGLMGRLSLMSIDAMWQLGLSCLLVGAVTGFLRYTGYLDFMYGPVNRVLLLTLVHVRLLGCLFFWLLASLRLGTTALNIAQLFMKEMVKNYFGVFKIQVKFLINWSLEVF